MKYFLVILASLIPLAAHSFDSAEIQFAKATLRNLQSISFSTGREYCGYFGYNSAGQFLASRPTKGRKHSCYATEPPADWDLAASYHTHGGFLDDADSEVPSVNDLESDIAERVDGFISTPGGRFWYLSGTTGVARQLCSIGCLPQDPKFEREVFGEVYETYTLRQLKQRESE